MSQKSSFYWLLIGIVISALIMISLLFQYNSTHADKKPTIKQEKTADNSSTQTSPLPIDRSTRQSTGQSTEQPKQSTEQSASSLALDFVSSEKIGLADSGIPEPSGLALSALSGELWSVSDDTSAVFKLNPNKLDSIADSIPVDESKMEGIALLETEGQFFTINENKGRIARFDMANGKRLERERIRDMVNYDKIKPIVEASGKNSGFEGITWHSGRKSLFLVLEGPPGLLIEVSADLKAILSAIALNQAIGFMNPDKGNAAIDLSGISYDATRDKFWIVSDQAERVFVFDLNSGKVVDTSALYWVNKKGKQKAVDKAEGVALSIDGKRLYVVSDSKARLFQWDIK